MAAVTIANSRFEEAALVRAAQAGDRAAFGALYQSHARMVHGILLAHVAYGEAEDLVQDVFLRALEQIQGLRQAEAFGGWLAAIARRAAADLHRRHRHGAPIPDGLWGASAAGEAFEVLDAIRALPKAYAETLTLRLVEGMTGPEIAARTGLTPESVRVNLCRGMKRLRKSLRGQSESVKGT